MIFFQVFNQWALSWIKPHHWYQQNFSYVVCVSYQERWRWRTWVSQNSMSNKLVDKLHVKEPRCWGFFSHYFQEKVELTIRDLILYIKLLNACSFLGFQPIAFKTTDWVKKKKKKEMGGNNWIQWSFQKMCRWEKEGTWQKKPGILHN